jgi:hypothetical protein
MTSQSGCPRHPVFSKHCDDVRCQKNWKVEGAPTPEEQLKMWVDGKAVCPNRDHECCPDFSCCKPHLMWDKERRERYMNTTQGEREKMCMGALGALLGSTAYVTRGNSTDNE